MLFILVKMGKPTGNADKCTKDRGNTTEKENIMGITILIERQWFQIQQPKLVEVRSRDEIVL